ncbi:hypothetical protein ACFO4N_05630 [Camelliibacillus cellulosilyticus]|uniref:DUF2550 family protein n=1 Tax=Camelliibacillus cellulosilyticus TaxID=2174486 RepID=A0ABV9GM00_9BACL
MDLILFIFIGLAVGCLGYSAFFYIRRSRWNASTSPAWVVHEEGDRLAIVYRNVAFTADLKFGVRGEGSERRFVVTAIHIRLDGEPNALLGWKKKDLYHMEKNLYTQYPYGEITWDEPMKMILKEEA